MLARSLARAGAWFWLDGSAPAPGGGAEPGDPAHAGRSYLGEAAAVLRAERGAEREFLGALRGAMRLGAATSGDPSGDSGSGSGSRTGSAEAAPGWVVALGYEFGVALMSLDPLPDAVDPGFALRSETVLVLDHATRSAELHGPDETALDAWLARHGDALRGAASETSDDAARNGREAPEERASPGEPAAGPARWSKGPAGYEAAVEACREAIREGDAYVLCLTDTARAEVPGGNPLDLYLRLRARGAELRGGVIVAGDRALVSLSPERFLQVRDGRVSTHPIKGTRPRGDTPENDAALARELAEDPKERAENLMIVDLMRNDLSRVCEPETVATEGFLRVETHARVHQLVSTVSGRLRKGSDVFDAIEACFPGGSMTGAPKRRAVEILASLEQQPRGLYSGCFGWIAGSGDAELAMTIRSIELRGLDAADGAERRGPGSPPPEARVGAGGGITADSDPARERAEKDLKAAPLLAVLVTDRPRGSRPAER